MIKATIVAVMVAFVALMTYCEDSWGFDAAEESTLIVSVAEGNWPEVEKACIDWRTKQPKSLVAMRLLICAYEEQSKMGQLGTLKVELTKADWIRTEHLEEVVAFMEQLVATHGESAVAWALLSNTQAFTRMKKDLLRVHWRVLIRLYHWMRSASWHGEAKAPHFIAWAAAKKL
jgi:hypothetical protein